MIANRCVPFVLLLALVVLSACASAADRLSVDDIWARPSDAGMNSAVYFILDNPTELDDRLVLASGDIADRVELHRSKQTEEGAMIMEPQESVPVPGGKTVQFKPGGLHVMLLNLEQDLKVGDTFPLVLQFENAGDVQIEVTVREP